MRLGWTLYDVALDLLWYSQVMVAVGYAGVLQRLLWSSFMMAFCPIVQCPLSGHVEVLF